MYKQNWKLLPYFLLRSTGFPFDWIERLACAETASALDDLLSCEEALATLTAEVRAALRSCEDATTRKLRQHCWDRVDRLRPLTLDEQARQSLGPALCQLLDQWSALLSRRDELEARARTTFAHEPSERRQSLRDIASDPGFQEATWLSSPQMFMSGLQTYLERWSPTHRPSEIRRIERQLISYLQRFCAKNDTASFFGPLNYGDFSTAREEQPPRPGAKHVQRREAFMAYWGVASLAAALMNDSHVRPYLRPRHSPICRIGTRGEHTVTVGEISFSISAGAARVIGLVDGSRTVSEIATLAGLSIDQIWQDLEQLARARVIVTGIEVPVTELRPLGWLLDRVRELPEDCPARGYWCDVLTECQEIQERFAQASFTERQRLLGQIETLVTKVAGVEPRRGAGQFYTDRLLIYEECLGGLTPLMWGPDCAEELRAQLAPVLDLYAAHACAAHQSLQSFGASLLSSLAPDGRMPLLTAIARLYRQHSLPDDGGSHWQHAMLAQLQQHSHERVVQLDPALLPPIDRAVFEDTVLLSSPDVMLMARDAAALRAGDFQVIIGECHDTLMIWGWALCFHPQRHMVEAAAADLLQEASGPHQLANLLASKRVKIVPFEFPGPTIEMMASSQKSPIDRIPIADVEAVVEDGRPKLRAPGWPDLMIHNGELPTLMHALFAPPRVVPFPLSLGEHTPRVMLGKAVIQREQWRVKCETFFPRRYRGASFELMYDYRRAARRLGLPRYVFVRVTGERKPVLIDRDNYFLLELLDYLLADKAEALVSEMLPSPDQLWLRDNTAAFCAELRLSMGYISAEGQGS